jgi:nucleotide-binding universal stress UspA family protein
MKANVKPPYRHILIPLDGSKLAEAALKEALPLVNSAGARVTFIEAVWPIIDVLNTGTQVAAVERLRKNEAQKYLDSVARRAEWKALHAKTAVKVGPAADVILDYARSKRADLIVMSTHGRSGLGRWAFGSIADKVLHGAICPVLLVRASGKRKR